MLLVEASERLGGKVRTERIDGFLVEAGPDSFIAYRPAAIELARELGLGDAIIRTTDPRLVHIRARGELVPMPDGMGLVLPTRMAPFVTTRLFSWPQKLRVGLDLVLPRWLDGEDVAVGAFLRRRLGGALVDRLAGPLLGGVYGAPVDELSLFAVVPQLRDSEREHRSLLFASLAQGRAARARARARGGARRAARERAGASAPAGGSRPATGPRRRAAPGRRSSASPAGWAASSTPWRTPFAPHPGPRSGSGPASWRSSAMGARTAVTLSDGTRLTPDAVILAGTAGSSAGLLADEVPAAAAAIRTIPHGSTGVVTLGYRAEALPGPLVGHGFLVAGDDPLSFGACTFTSSKWAGRAPDGTILLRAFLPERSAALLDATDDAVVARRPRRPRPDGGRPRGTDRPQRRPLARGDAALHGGPPRPGGRGRGGARGAAGDHPGGRRLPRRRRPRLRGPRARGGGAGRGPRRTPVAGPWLARTAAAAGAEGGSTRDASRDDQPPKAAASSLICAGPTRQHPPTRRAPAATQRRAVATSTSGPEAGSQRPVPASHPSPEFG